MDNIIRPLRFLPTIFILSLVGAFSSADSQPPGDINSKAFEGAVSLAQTLIQWAFLIFGGSVALSVGGSHRQHRGRIKYAYFLFLPGWLLLALSFYWGRSVQGVYLAFLFQMNQNISQLRQAANHDAYWQMLTLEIGLGFFTLWLLFYIFWWVLTDLNENEDR